MPINIILDKSAFQSFNHDELILLNNYYCHNVTPIICMEVIGDLSKEIKEAGKSSKEQVERLAYRLFPSDIVINVPYYDLIQQELWGKSVPIDGKPIVELEKIVETPTGSKAVVFKETILEMAIRKWKDGEFVELDFQNSNHWRDRTTNKDLLAGFKKKYGHIPEFNALNTIEKVNSFVEKWLCDPAKQENLLNDLLTKYVSDGADQFSIYNKWYMASKPGISEFAPYSCYCIKVELLFMLGVLNGHIKNQSTNQVDMQYLYFLPFCDVFCSDDKFFDVIIPFVIRENQNYVKGVQIKKDIKNILNKMNTMEEDVKMQFYKVPPIDYDSYTFQLWKKYYDYPNNNNIQRELTETEIAEMRIKINSFEQAMFNDAVFKCNEEDVDMFGKVSSLSKNDPCPVCKSGKRVIDCCIPEDRFNEILKTQGAKFNNNGNDL